MVGLIVIEKVVYFVSVVAGIHHNTARPLSAGKIVTDVSLAKSLSAFSSSVVMLFRGGGRQLLMAEVTEALIRSFSASESLSMPDSIEATI